MNSIDKPSPVVYSPPALPDLLVAGVARRTVSKIVSVKLNHPPPVTGMRTEALTGAQGVHEHLATEIVLD